MGWFGNALAMLSRGGLMMGPLLFCSLASVTVIMWRGWRIWTASADTSALVKSTEKLLYDGHSEKAASSCESSATPVGAVLAAGIRRRCSGVQSAERAMEAQAMEELASLQQWLWSLDTIITVAPLLGLLGTVTGMINSFHVISSKDGISTPTAITGGVAEALIATATGLVVAMVTLLAYNFLNERVKHCVHQMETSATHITNVIAEIEEQRHEVKQSLSA